MESDCECLYSLCAVLLKNGSEDGAIIPPAEKYAHRNVSDHAVVECGGQQFVHFTHRLVKGDIKLRCFVIVEDIPVDFFVQFSILEAERNIGARLQLKSILKDGVWCGNVSVVEKHSDRSNVELLAECRDSVE